MIVSLLLGREGSVGFPGKNVFPVMGRPLMSYPLLAAKNSRYIDKMYVSTDSALIRDVAHQLGAEVIDRPAQLCTSEALSEDSWFHGYQSIKALNPGSEIECLVLLFCNAPTVMSFHIDEGIEMLRRNKMYDSAATVSIYNTFHPIRARKIGKDGTLEPFIPMEIMAQLGVVNSDRKCLGDVYYADCSMYVVRPRCLDNIDSGMPPQKWMGNKIAPIKNWGGLDIDYKWEVPQAEYWLREHGFTENKIPY